MVENLKPRSLNDAKVTAAVLWPPNFNYSLCENPAS
jgi:hypothetical protein